MKNFLIYGAGALGQALGCMLASDGHQVDLVLRERYFEQIAQQGLKVTGILGDFSAPRQNLGLLTSISQATKKYDYALITTKAYDTQTAVNDIAILGDRAANIVSMQNGCGNLELLEDCFGSEKSLGGRVITGFEIVSPGLINITVSADAIHVGSSRNGTIPHSVELLAELITLAGHRCLAVEDIHQSLFAKLLYNCTLNPLGAILGVHYGALGEQEESRLLMEKVIEETFEVIEGLGGKTPWADAAAYTEVFYETLLPATYNHRPSMLQDLENEKLTEVDALVGYVSNQGKKLGLTTTTCDLLTALVKFKQAQTFNQP